MVALGRVWALGTGNLWKTVKARILRTGGGLGKSLSIFVDEFLAGPVFPGPQAALSCAAGALSRVLSQCWESLHEPNRKPCLGP